LQRVCFDLPGGTLSALQFGDPATPLRLVFCHANGFNGESYRAVLEPLGVHALALDLRGHGMTDLPCDVPRLANWQIFADDIAEFFNREVDTPVVLAGHSYGAVSGVLSMPQTRKKVAGYVGFDPVLVPWLFRQVATTASGRAYMKRRIPIARKSGQRKSVFNDLETAFARYQGRGAFKGVPDAILRDYLQGGLIATDDGQMRLACDPLWEQAIFAAQAHNIFRHIPLLPDNSRIVFAGARGQVSRGGQRKRLQRLQPGVSVEFQPEYNHLFPLQEPAFATEVLRSVLDRAVS
jgi:pimeloyl-ACP methyl ester carboxylesterase